MKTHSATTALLRIGGAVVGGYALAAAIASACALVFHDWFDWPRSEAALLASMAAFVIYLLLILWAFSVNSTGRMLATLAAGIIAVHGLLRMLAA